MQRTLGRPPDVAGLGGAQRDARLPARRDRASRQAGARRAIASAPVRRLPEPPLAVIVFCVGLSILGAEIAAARLLAPYFGASTIVWANTIGIVLVALSVGYWYGGKLADRDPTRDGLYRIVLLSGLLLAAVPFAADPLLGFAVDALDSISAGAFVGSLLGVTVLVAIPILVSGAVAPYALRLAVADVEHAGTVSGRLYAISTVGSLLGTFSSALLFIPLIGTRRTFLVFGLVLVVIAAIGLARARYLAAPLALAVLLTLPVGTVKGKTDFGSVVIHETDTEYQYARVVQDADRTRILELNEGQAVHSVRRPGSYLTGDYWDEMLVLPFAGSGRAPRSIAILGNAAGTTARAYGHFFPATRIDAVEIDGELTDIGRRYFDLRGPQLHTHAADARPFLRRTKQRYDAIVVDAYRQPYIPFYLSTREFFALARERLRPGGVLLVNVGHPERSDRLEKVLSATLADIFPTVLRDPSEPTNTVLLGSAGAASGPRLAAAARSMPALLRPVGADAAA
ncbi:MAG: fused MFS/spermidine synthase, partial [Solirubrobacterales bacterium]|nr:fused MFS/spermidine synthase [Solirubrobacterales bacterium]